MNKYRVPGLLVLALALGLALRIPGWYTADKKQYGGGFEPDEGQHVQIASVRFNELAGEKLVDENSTGRFNVRGYGHLMAYAGYGWWKVSGQLPEFRGMLLLGRQLSTVFSVLLVLVVFLIGRVGGLSPPLALTAAFLMAACDVNATYAHYALPAAGYIFFCYLAVLGAFRLVRDGETTGTVLLALGAGGAFAFKFDFLPIVWGGLLLLVLLLRGRLRLLPFFAGVGTLLVTVFSLLHGWTWDEMFYSVNLLREVNADDIKVDDHWRDNLLVYPLGVLAGIGLPAFGLAVVGLVKLLKRPAARSLIVLFLLVWLGSEFYVRWSTDTAFIRRVNVFMPAVVLLAAYSLGRLGASRKWRVALVTYTFAFGVVGQSNHWFDTRVAALAYVNQEITDQDRVRISPYLTVEGWPKHQRFEGKAFDLLVVHETYYSRYYKSMTTPFGLPTCTEGVYHPGSRTMCETYQALLTGNHPTAELAAEFRTHEVFPERILYKRLLGNYETFLGDVLVFRSL